MGGGRERSSVAAGFHGNRPRPRRGRIIIHLWFHREVGYRPGKGWPDWRLSSAAVDHCRRMRGWRICSSARFFSESAKTIARSAARFNTPSAEKIASPNSSRKSWRTSGSLSVRCARRAVGIKKRRARQFVQETGESRFTGGNATGDADDGAGFGHEEVRRLYRKAAPGATPFPVCNRPRSRSGAYLSPIQKRPFLDSSDFEFTLPVRPPPNN